MILKNVSKSRILIRSMNNLWLEPVGNDGAEQKVSDEYKGNEELDSFLNAGMVEIAKPVIKKAPAASKPTPEKKPEPPPVPKPKEAEPVSKSEPVEEEVVTSADTKVTSKKKTSKKKTRYKKSED